MLRIILALILLAINLCGWAQKDPSSKKYCFTFSTLVPAGNFSETHFGGLGISFGNRGPGLYLFRSKTLGVAYEAGFNFFFGKKETVSGYEYRYENYLQLFTIPGFIYQVKKTTFDVGAGIGGSHYDRHWRFNLMAKAGARYSLMDRFAIGAGLLLSKEKKADPLWSAILKACYYL